MSGFDFLSGFLATLLATLIGVAVAFWNDRKIDQVNQYQRTKQHLRSIEEELTRNRKTIDHIIDVVAKLQDEEGGESSHYAVDILSTEAWRAAIDDGIIESLDGELYRDLNEIYYRTKAVNELIRRLRTESLHPSLGEKEDEGLLDWEVWTITVTYWDEEKEDVKEAELATVLKNKSNRLGIRIDGVIDSIDDQVGVLEKKKNRVEKLTLKRLTRIVDQGDERE